MPSLYEINSQISEIIEKGFAIDEETGEIISDLSELEELQAEREIKIENTLLFYKNLKAEAKMLKDEEAALKARREKCEKKADKLKDFIEYILAGENFKTAKVAVSYRTSKSVNVSDGFVEWATKNRPELLRVKEPEADKTALRKLLTAGEEIPGASFEENLSMTIK